MAPSVGESADGPPSHPAASDGTTVRTVPLIWRHRESEAPGEGEPAADAWESEVQGSAEASWRWHDPVHHLAYRDPGEVTAGGAAGEDTRTVLRIEPGSLTMSRFGAVRWNHTWVLGQRRTSVLHAGGLDLSIETHTHHWRAAIGPDGGVVEVTYELRVNGAPRVVSLQIRFGQEVLGDETTGDRRGET